MFIKDLLYILRDVDKLCNLSVNWKRRLELLFFFFMVRGVIKRNVICSVVVSAPSHIASLYGSSPADMSDAITQPIELYTFLRQWLRGKINCIP
jgi:hypothetical protein